MSPKKALKEEGAKNIPTKVIKRKEEIDIKRGFLIRYFKREEICSWLFLF